MEKAERQRILESVRLPLYFLGTLWGIHLLQWLTGNDLAMFGVHPRHFSGLSGIVTGPLVHENLSHLFSNSVPLFVSAVLIAYFFPRVAIKTFVYIYVFTGLAVWALGREVFHIGASGIVYGMVAFIFFNGMFRRNTRSIVLALIVTLLYSGMIAGLVPDEANRISWESHLLGAVVGMFLAYAFRGQIEPDDEELLAKADDAPKRYFLPRDIFEPDAPPNTSHTDPPGNWIQNSTWRREDGQWE